MVQVEEGVLNHNPFPNVDYLDKWEAGLFNGLVGFLVVSHAFPVIGSGGLRVPVFILRMKQSTRWDLGQRL
jgi:hypothetical protein